MVATALKRAAFARERRQEWSWRGRDLALVLGLQKSAYGPSYYLNVGVTLGQDISDGVPASILCGVTSRLDQWIDGGRLLERTLDLSSLLTAEDRASSFSVLIDEQVIPCREDWTNETFWLSGRADDLLARSLTNRAGTEALGRQH